jgi:hypothetical protein
MQHTKRFVLIVLLVTICLLPVVASAQGANRAEATDTVRFTRGERPQIGNAPAKGEQTATGKLIPGPNRPVMPASEPEKLGVAAAARSGSVFLVKEGYEFLWPADSWSTFDNNGSLGGDVCWDDDNFMPRRGNWSAWAANGCTDGLDPEFSFYPNDTDSWMVYGPFDTQAASKGSVTFQYKNDSEFFFDVFYWCVTADFFFFDCGFHTGTTGGKWKTGKLNLANVNGFNYLGQPFVWAVWVFQSDYSIVDQGPFVDSVKILLRR